MLVVKTVDPVKFYNLFSDVEPAADLCPQQWAAVCRERGFLAFVALDEDAFAGYAVAESNHRVLHVLNLEGDVRTCHRLLERLVRLAGERDVSSRCPVARADVQRLLHWMGFAYQGTEDCRGWPCHLYHLGRNEA